MMTDAHLHLNERLYKHNIDFVQTQPLYAAQANTYTLAFACLGKAISRSWLSRREGHIENENLQKEFN